MKTLFDKTKIKNMELKNRFIRSGTWKALAEENGHLNEEIINLYEELAKGGVGLIMAGYSYVSKDEKPNPKMLGIHEDSLIEEYKVLVDRVHKYGAKIALQLAYGGSQCTHPDYNKMIIYGPSAVENIETGITPIEATKENIKEIINMFADAAVRAKKAGFDGVQIHAAHGYLLSQFLTPYYNRRQDEYGGDIHNRARIIYETVEEIRNRVGEDYPVMIKINVTDGMERNRGLIEEEAIELSKKLDEIGIDLIETSGGNLSSGEEVITFKTKLHKVENQSYFAETASDIAKEVCTKVSLVGGNKNFNRMNQILNSTKIEYFSLSRALFSEPDLINKWMENKDYKAKCVSCNHCWDTRPHVCIINR